MLSGKDQYFRRDEAAQEGGTSFETHSWLYNALDYEIKHFVVQVAQVQYLTRIFKLKGVHVSHTYSSTCTTPALLV